MNGPSTERLTRYYEVAGLRVRLDGDVFESDLLAERWGPFKSDADTADLHLDIEPAVGFYNEEVADGRLVDSPYVLRNGLWTVHRIDYEGTFVAPGNLRARTDGTVGALNGLLRHLLVVALLERGGLLLHAAGFLAAGQALALAGPSGAGKTTACRHSPAWTTVLGDEQIALCPRGGEIWACGTPIIGELARPGLRDGGPLHAIHFIEHASQNRCTRLGVRDGLRRLLPTTVFYPRDRDINARAIDVCASIASRVPTFRLEALGDGSFWPLLQAAQEQALA